MLTISRTIHLPAARHAAKPLVQAATSSITVGRTQPQRRRSPVAPASNRTPIRPPPPAGTRSCQDRTQCRTEPSCPALWRVLSWIWAARQNVSAVGYGSRSTGHARFGARGEVPVCCEYRARAAYSRVAEAVIVSVAVPILFHPIQ